MAILLGLLAAYALAAQDVKAILGPMLLAGILAFVFGLLEDVTKKVGVLPRPPVAQRVVKRPGLSVPHYRAPRQPCKGVA